MSTNGSTLVTHIVVVGGGAMGSAAAWALSRRGMRVTLLEQFGPGHVRGASHGSSRIFRQAYSEDGYVALAARSFELWKELESASGQTLLTLTSALDHGDPEIVNARVKPLQDAGIPYELLTPAEAGARWPGLRFDTVVLTHPGAGRVHADDSLTALQSETVRLGGEVRHHVAVLDIVSTSEGVVVRTSDGDIHADHVVVAPGAWATDLLGEHIDLPVLRTTQEQPAFFTPLKQDAAIWPSFVHHPGAELSTEGIYGLGSVEGIKIGEHATGPEVHPDSRDFIPLPAGERRLIEYAREWLPGVDADSATSITCLYTVTPDHNFIVDRRGNITFAAGFSGHGFKFTPVIGELLADLALENIPAPDFLRLDREGLRVH